MSAIERKYPVNKELSPERFIELMFTCWARNVSINFWKSPSVIYPFTVAVARAADVDTYQLRTLFIHCEHESIDSREFISEALAVFYQQGVSQDQMMWLLRMRNKVDFLHYWQDINEESVTTAYPAKWTEDQRKTMLKVLKWWDLRMQHIVWKGIRK